MSKDSNFCCNFSDIKHNCEATEVCCVKPFISCCIFASHTHTRTHRYCVLDTSGDTDRVALLTSSLRARHHHKLAPFGPQPGRLSCGGASSAADSLRKHIDQSLGSGTPPLVGSLRIHAEIEQLRRFIFPQNNSRKSRSRVKGRGTDDSGGTPNRPSAKRRRSLCPSMRYLPDVASSFPHPADFLVTITRASPLSLRATFPAT